MNLPAACALTKETFWPALVAVALGGTLVLRDRRALAQLACAVGIAFAILALLADLLYLFALARVPGTVIYRGDEAAEPVLALIRAGQLPTWWGHAVTTSILAVSAALLFVAARRSSLRLARFTGLVSLLLGSIAALAGVGYLIALYRAPHLVFPIGDNYPMDVFAPIQAEFAPAWGLALTAPCGIVLLASAFLIAERRLARKGQASTAAPPDPANP